MRDKQEPMTNERFNRRFTSQFDLVNYAINLAEQMIKSGRGPRVSTDVKNTAFQILQEIGAGRDTLEEREDDYYLSEEELAAEVIEEAPVVQPIAQEESAEEAAV